MCVDPQTYGHCNRYGTGGENKLPEEAKAERREVIENNKAWRAAEPVRRDYIRSLLNAGKVPKGTLRFVTAEIMADPAEIGRGPDDLIAGSPASPLRHRHQPLPVGAHRWACSRGQGQRRPARLISRPGCRPTKPEVRGRHTWRQPNAGQPGRSRSSLWPATALRHRTTAQMSTELVASQDSGQGRSPTSRRRMAPGETA
jgi:hypothetical protein